MYIFYLDSKSSSSQSKVINIRKTNRYQTIKTTSNHNNLSTPMTEDISDDDMPLIDIRKHKKKSIDTLSIPSARDSIIPLATDLQSLPGLSHDETRDTRFLNYSDIDTLSLHFNSCLFIDKRSLSTSRQYIYKTHYNIWNKILKLYYVKTFRKKLFSENSSNKSNNHKQQPLSVISSPTAVSFKMDWNVNRRNSTSSHRHTPKNFFHILQLTPKTQISSLDNSSSISIQKTPMQTFERMKDVLARTYYPHVYTAIEYGYQFGAKSKFPNAQQLVSTHNTFINIKEMPESPNLLDESTTITLKSPPSTTRRTSTITPPLPTVSVPNETKQKKTETNEKPSLSKLKQSSTTDDLSSFLIKKSVVLLTPTKIPLPKQSSSSLTVKEDNSTNRKRKASSTNVTERTKKRIVSSPEQFPQIENISESERYCNFKSSFVDIVF